MSQAQHPGACTGAGDGWQRLRVALQRPDDMVEGTRWLFCVLAIVSLVITAPSALVNTPATMRLIAVISIGLLAYSCIRTYVSQTTHWSRDLGDSTLITAMTLASDRPAAVLGFVFASLWFRGLYGSTLGALLRCSMYVAAAAAATLLWQEVPGHPEAVQLLAVLGAAPTMYLTVAVGRHLTGAVGAREQAAARNAVQATAGAKLLGLTDPRAIRLIADKAADDMCAVTPGLRVLVVSRAADLLRVGHASGTAAAEDLPAEVLQWLDQHPDAAIADPSAVAALNKSAGETCAWTAIPLPDSNQNAWLLMGIPGRLRAEVVDSLNGLVSQVTLALRNSHAHRELTLKATSDPLTGLANRHLFEAELRKALQDTGGRSAVLFLDLDDFKDVNDVFGHAAGDTLLQAVARRLRDATRPIDTCARLGGDEFAVLLPGADSDTAAKTAQRIVQAVAGPMPLLNGHAQIGASVGVATADGAMDAQALVHQADVAMYAAKAAGKNRMQVYSPGLLQQDAQQHVFDRELAAAAANRELVVHYQPVLDLRNGRCIAMEALVRWQHPTRGLIYPGDFIEVAERTGAIRSIGAFVVRQACADLAEWGQPAMTVHVNVSALQLDDEAFGVEVARSIGDAGLTPDRLVLEVTETVMVSAPAAIQQLNVLAAYGVTIAIDDFGTGYSALTTLRSLPVTIVKIDQSFVAGSMTDANDRAVTEAIIDMAKRMRLQTIAEGVERPEQEAFLSLIGADAAQGYFYLRPTPAAEFRAWLQARPVRRPGAVAARPQPASDVPAPRTVPRIGAQLRTGP